MSEKYIPLYRKYRPKTLEEVVGQSHIKKALANAINLNKISHAYLFTGPRGTGKTSTARIMAKSLNCQEGPTLTPCGKCPSCTDIMNSVPIDVIEIDAASNRKVEDAQNILEKIQYVPVNGKYKIYIIDEVHMLTNHAFNALLKTLEEPPENVIFILATTEPQKVLETITSRCQRFDFRRITTDDIVGHLKNIAKLEKIKIEDDALFTIAKNAAGGMRDSLALLDQVSVLDGTKTIASDDVNTLLGRLSFDVLLNLVEKIIQSKPQEAIEDLEKIYNSGNEPTQILTNLLAYFKNLLIVKNCQDSNILVELTQLNDVQINSIKIQSEHIDTHQIVFLIEKIVYYIKELKTTNNQHLWLEISMIDLANLAQNTSLLELQARIERLESGAPPQGISQPYTTQPAPIAKAPVKVAAVVVEPVEEKVERAPEVEKVAKKEPKPTPIEETNVEAVVEEQEFSPMPKAHHAENSGSEIIELWKNLLANIPSPPTRALLSDHARPVEISAEQIVIACEKELFLRAINTDAKKKLIAESAEKLFGTPVNIVVRAPKSSDVIVTAPVQVEKKNLITEKKAEAPITAEDENDLQEIIEDVKVSSSMKVEVSSEHAAHSDQVTMVMNLFDGKYID